MEGERSGHAYRVALLVAGNPAAAQRFADLGDLGGFEVLGQQTGHVDGVCLRRLGRSLLTFDASGHAVGFARDLADVTGAGCVEDRADGPGRDVVLPGGRLHRDVLRVRVDDVGCLDLVERGRAPQRPARRLDGDAFPGVLCDHVALDFKDPGEHGDEQLGLRVVGREVEAVPRAGRDAQVQTAPLENCADLKDILGKAEQPRRLRDPDDVADRRLVQQPTEPGPVDRVDAGRCGRILVRERTGREQTVQSTKLTGVGLLVSGMPQIQTVSHVPSPSSSFRLVPKRDRRGGRGRRQSGTVPVKATLKNVPISPSPVNGSTSRDSNDRFWSPPSHPTGRMVNLLPALTGRSATCPSPVRWLCCGATGAWCSGAHGEGLATGCGRCRVPC